MAADHLEFLKERFIREFHEAKEVFVGEFPLHPEFQGIEEWLQKWTIKPSTPIEMKNGLYDLIYELEECSMLAEKERHRKRQNQKGSFNVYTVKKLWFIHKTRNKLLQIKGNLEKLEANATVESPSLSDSISTVCSLWNSSWLQHHFPSEIHGFHDELQKIKALLLQQADNDDGGIKTIGIVGMSGIGKTTLARMVVNDQDCREEFSPIIWVTLTLSQNLDPSEIMRLLLDTLSGNIDNDAQIINHDDPEQQLRELLSNKKYLIVLDNAWHPNDLGSNLQTDGTTIRRINHLCHGLPKGGGGAIIVTSGFEEVATSMVGDQNLFRLHPTIFNAEAVWSMFMDSIHRKEFLTPNQHQMLLKMKDEIIDRCDGLPLAAKTLAEIISTQMGKEEYDYWSILRLRKKFRLRLDQLDDISYNKAMEKVKALQGVEDVSRFRAGEITIIGRCLPVEIARELGKLWHTELISVEQIQKIAQEVSFFHKKFILKLDLHGDKDANKAMKIVSKISGTDSISMDMKEKKLTVVGDVDPVKLVRKMRKYWHTDIISIGPGPARQPPKKEKSGTKMLCSSIFRCSCINQIKE